MGSKYIWQEPARACKRRLANKTNENARRCTRKIARNIGKNNKRGKRRLNLHNIIKIVEISPRGDAPFWAKTLDIARDIWQGKSM